MYAIHSYLCAAIHVCMCACFMVSVCSVECPCLRAVSDVIAAAAQLAVVQRADAALQLATAQWAAAVVRAPMWPTAG